ncbi:hypothetical protein [Picosynechococcus sp. NKBG042902]|nr:hypothetical protein [Picosynechococcus sp. NKBG042902]
MSLPLSSPLTPILGNLPLTPDSGEPERRSLLQHTSRKSPVRGFRG